MAKKKSTAPTAPPLTSIQKDLPKKVQPEITKFNNLKAFNQLLLKETMEKRSEVDSLKSQIEEMKECQSFMSKIEHEVCRIVIGTAMAEKSKVDSGLVEKLGSMEKERDFIKNALEGKVKELEMDSMAIRDELGHCLGERDVTDRMWKKKEEASNSLQELMEGREKEKGGMGMKFEETASQMEQKVDEYVMKIKKSEKEAFEVNNAIRRLEGEFGALRGENERLRVKVAELEMKGRDDTQEINKIRVNIIEVEKEKEEMKREFENKFRNLEKGYKEKNEKSKKEIDSLGLTISFLKKEKNKQEMKHKSKVSEVHRRFDEKIREAQNEVARLRENTADLEKDNEEAQKKFDADTRELGSRLVESNRKLRNVLRESDRMEKISRKQAVEIAELKKTVETLNSRILMFKGNRMEPSEKKCINMQNERIVSEEKDDIEKKKTVCDQKIVELKKKTENVSTNISELERRNNKLQSENDAVKTELNAERKASEGLKRKYDESAKKLKQLDASLNELASEKDAARKHIELLEKKMKAAEMISEKSLILLKRAKHVICDSENIEENDGFYDKEIQPFCEELKNIGGDFKSGILKIEEMNREVAMLKVAVKEAKTNNPKPGILTWLYPVFTTTVLAAISFAYAARSRWKVIQIL